MVVWFRSGVFTLLSIVVLFCFPYLQHVVSHQGYTFLKFFVAFRMCLIIKNLIIIKKIDYNIFYASNVAMEGVTLIFVWLLANVI